MSNKGLHPLVYVAFRVGAFYASPKGKNIIEEHDKITTIHGSAFLGKAGRILTEEKMDLIERMISDNGCSKLYLIQKQEASFVISQADIYSITTDTPDLEKIPEYYRNRASSDMNFWFEIGQFVSTTYAEAASLRLLSSNRPLMDVLRECRTTLMLVTS